MSGGSSKLTHYEVLGVRRDCTQEQLKNAFLTLSKKYHPDINTSDTKLHNKFVKINEAYSVLRAVDTRRMYDLQLGHNSYQYGSQSIRRASPYYRGHFEDEHWTRQRFYYDPSIDPQRHRGRGPYPEDMYYGFKGLPRQPNFTIVAGCILFVAIGSLAQFIAIMYGSRFNRSLLKSQSDSRAIIYGQTKMTAQQNGNEKQLDILAQKLGQDPND